MTHPGHGALVRVVAEDERWRRSTVRLAFVNRLVRVLWRRMLSCSASPNGSGDPAGLPYRRLVDVAPSPVHPLAVARTDTEADADLVVLKISLLGDCHIGKTSFMYKYVGDAAEEEEEKKKKGIHMTGLSLMEKLLFVRGARIAFSIWDVAGDHQYRCHVPLACKDAAAILIMFDLTDRRTLSNVIRWYQQARKWNKTAIPVLIGTKFDDFFRLPLDLQWTVVNEARASARAMNAILFFSSATHNINVNKIFKFITAKHFNLPWTLERNLIIGEPIIDF